MSLVVVVVVGLIGSLFFFVFLLASHSAQSTNRRNGPLFFPFGFRRLPLAFFPYYSLSARPAKTTSDNNNNVRKSPSRKFRLKFGQLGWKIKSRVDERRLISLLWWLASVVFFFKRCRWWTRRISVVSSFLIIILFFNLVWWNFLNHLRLVAFVSSRTGRPTTTR